MNKIGGYIGLARRANYLIIGSDNIKNYNKKLYLIILSNDCGVNVESIGRNKAGIYKIPCIKCKYDLSEFLDVSNCKIIGVKNKGLSEQILKYSDDFELVQ